MKKFSASFDDFDEFAAEVCDYCREEPNLPERFRTLSLLRAGLAAADSEKNYAALSLIDCEHELIRMELAHPGRFAHRSPAASLATWEGTISELLELVVALSLTGLIRTRDNKKMTLAEIAKLFGSCFGIEFKDFYGRKSRILTRKKNESPFLDKLIALYRKEVEKMGQ